MCVATLAVALTGCGQGHEGQGHDKPAESSVTSTSIAPSTSTTAQAAGKQCPPQGDRRITITNGDVTCAEAYSVAAKFDPQGQKYQDIDAFECGTGTADVRPLVFECTSEDAEFGVHEG